MRSLNKTNYNARYTISKGNKQNLKLEEQLSLKTIKYIKIIVFIVIIVKVK